MTRRIKRTARGVFVRRVAWTALEWAKFFRLADDDWTPPAEVVIRQGSRTWTYVADFVMANGHPCRLTVKIDPARRIVLDEQMSVSWKIRGGK